jgi:subfamily B ATP-binding cassette protein MsbA
VNFRKRALLYLTPFRGKVVCILLFNVLYALFSLFSLSMVLPFLSVLLGDAQAPASMPVFAWDTQNLIEMYYYGIGQLIFQKGKVFTLILVACSMVFFSFLSNLFRYLALYNMAPIRCEILKKYRNDLYDKILTLPLSFFSNQKKGDLLNRMGSDAQEVEWSIISTIQTLCRDPFMLIFFLITLFAVNWKLTFISLIIIPLTGLLIGKIGRSIKRNSIKVQNLLGRMSVRFEEAVSGLKIIKTYNAIDSTYLHFAQENRQFSKINTKLSRISDLATPLTDFLSILALTVILALGSAFVMGDSAFKGEIFVLYIVIFARLLPPAKQLVMAYYTIQKGLASYHRIEYIMDTDEQITENENSLPITQFNRQIEYKNVYFSYLDDKYPVLKNINLTIKKGEIIAIVGPSGSGKSTLIDLLSRFYDVQSGDILIDGISIKKLKINDLRSLFGIVTQEVVLFHDSISNNIGFGHADCTQEDIIVAARIAQADNFIMKLPEGYDTVIGDGGMNLSGGERQRLSIARTILKNPDILILDEATSALDTESEYLVQQSIKQLIKNKTALIIAHRLSTIRHANRIVFLQDGEIVESGTHAELIALQGAYWKFCELQELK